jgi:hypothetical protein
MIKHTQKLYQLIFFMIAITLFIACGSSKSSSPKSDVKQKEAEVAYGEEGKSKVSSKIYQQDGGIVYFPSDRTKENPTPVVFLEPGWFTNKLDPSEHNSSTMYKTLIEFVVSHGVTLIYAPTRQDKSNIDIFMKLAQRDDVLPYIDTTRIGVLGHSAGGGHTYYDIKKLSKHGWGENGKFVMAFDPWFAFGMKEEDLKTLPKDLNIIIQQFSKNKATDPRISLTTYYLLDSIADEQKDYQVYKDATHSYVQDYARYEDKAKKDISQMQHVLEPLDALMAYTFKNQESARDVALEVGSDDPIADKTEEVNERASYKYGCKNDYIGKLINYCKILP